MLQKVLPIILLIGVQFIFSWYGYRTGQLPATGSLFGWKYNSTLISILVIQLKFLWLFVIANFLFTMAFQIGLKSFQSFLIVLILNIVAWPITVILFNRIFSKEQLDIPILIGLALITAGTALVIAHRELSSLF